MTLVSLIWWNIVYRRIRVTLTTISIGFAFLVFGLVQGVDTSIKDAIARQNIDRLIVCSKVSCMSTLPISLAASISTLDGVLAVSSETSFFAYYQRQNVRINAKVVDPVLFFKSYRELEVSLRELEAMRVTPNAIIVGSDLALKYGWKIGDDIPLFSSLWKNQDGTLKWTFHLVGIFAKDESSGPSSLTNSLLINYTYFDEARPPQDRGIVGNFVVNISTPSLASEISKEIDDRFANSGFGTRTQSEREFAQAQVRKVGDLGTATHSIVGAILFTMLFVIGNTVMQSINDRSVDFAVMKALGFPSYLLTCIIVGEASFICAVGVALGLTAAIGLFPHIGFVGNRELPLETVGFAMLVSMAIALIASLPPIIRVARLKVVDTISRG